MRSPKEQERENREVKELGKKKYVVVAVRVE